MKNFVYIMINRAMPNWVKVGHSINPEKRAKQLTNAGDPYPHEVIYKVAIESEYTQKVEKKAHAILVDYKVNREWFNCATETAKHAIHQASMEYNILLNDIKYRGLIIKDGVAIDTERKLMWLRFAYGQEWHDNNPDGELKLTDWSGANDFVKRFNNQHQGYNGYTDWRLPSLTELKSLIDNTEQEKFNCCINLNIFPKSINATSSWYWSYSLVENTEEGDIYGVGVWGVNFKTGRECWEDNYEYNCVRLVRDTQ